MKVYAILQWNPCPDHDASTAVSMMFRNVLGPIACTLFLPDAYTITSGFTVNLDLTMNVTLPHSDTIKFTWWWHHFNRAPLDCTDNRTQTRGTRAYRLFMYSLRPTVVTAIVLLMETQTLNVKRMGIDLRFHLAITAYRFSSGVVTFVRLAAYL